MYVDRGAEAGIVEGVGGQIDGVLPPVALHSPSYSIFVKMFLVKKYIIYKEVQSGQSTVY
jgi:hypothetical protein